MDTIDNLQNMIDELESQYSETSVYDHQRRIDLLFRTIHILISMIYQIRKEKSNG
jgi:hypothetical protein